MPTTGDSLQSLILNKYSTPIFAFTELFLALLSLGPSPSFVPLVLLIATLRLHGLRIASRIDRLLQLFSSWTLITLGSTVAHYSSATNALSSSSQSFAAVAMMSALTYACATLSFYLDIRSHRHLKTVWAQLTLFPLIWATTWCLLSHISPLGRLLNWSPVSASHPYGWLLPYTGPLGVDWAVAACAVLCSDVAAIWLMRSDEQDHPVHLSTYPSENHEQSKIRSRSLLALGALLILLALPSLHVLLPTRTDTVFDASPLGVACALPPVRNGRHPALPDFVAETRKLTSLAKVVLWPESAVLFNSHDEREAAFEELRVNVQQSLIGVAFEEFVPEDSTNPGGSRMKRNGLALIHGDQKKGEEVVHYYKRNLVPFTESFSAIPSTTPPNIYTLELSHPKWISQSEWSSTPNHTRPIPITSSICLDLAFSSAFSSLESRPALILAPARTWDPTVSLTMWEQAKSRANEIGSMVLWCDGGATGVSGVGGGGLTEIMQVGAGSWARTIGLPFPYDQGMTVYARLGKIGVFILLVAIMGGGPAVGYLLGLSRRHSVLDVLPIFGRLIPGRRSRTDTENLIDFGGEGERQRQRSVG